MSAPEPAAALRLHADCRPVRGARNGAIYDLGRRRIHTVPAGYLDALPRIEGLYRQEDLARDAQGDAQSRNLAGFVQYLLDHELAHFTRYAERFPSIASDWSAPCEVQNAILDVDSVHHDFAALLAQLDALGCQFVQIRCYSDLLEMADLEAIGRAAANTSIRSVELLLPHAEKYPLPALERLLRAHLIYSALALHSAPEDADVEIAYGDRAGEGISEVRRILLFRARLVSSDDCGVIVPAMVLPPGLNQFMEAHGFNGCLNGKISVDAQGRIRNCPSLARDFGAADRVPLAQVVGDAEFRAPWGIAKDAIEICRDCELRYACTDCRAFTVRPDDLHSKPAKCGYDPYTGKWDLRVDTQEAGTPGYTRHRHAQA